MTTVGSKPSSDVFFRTYGPPEGSQGRHSGTKRQFASAAPMSAVGPEAHPTHYTLRLAICF